MNDKHPDAITVELDGKTRRIKLGPAAFRIAKKKGVLEIDITDTDNLGLDSLAHLVFIGLLVDEPELDEISVMQWLAGADEATIIRDVLALLTDISQSIMPAAAPEANGAAKRKKKIPV